MNYFFIKDGLYDQYLLDEKGRGQRTTEPKLKSLLNISDMFAGGPEHGDYGVPESAPGGGGGDQPSNQPTYQCTGEERVSTVHRYLMSRLNLQVFYL
jgi:hypothetical protein